MVPTVLQLQVYTCKLTAVKCFITSIPDQSETEKKSHLLISYSKLLTPTITQLKNGIAKKRKKEKLKTFFLVHSHAD